MFSGLDSIDWGGMQHAYGPATDVPTLLCALVSDDPAAREYGLDGMYGAVHHQGDVYECTVAAIPFLLEAAAIPGLPGRGGVLKLLASIGGADWDDAGSASERPTYQAAHRAVGAAGTLFLRLLGDPDPEVRRAAPKVLQACRDDAQQVIAALRERALGEEPDAEVRAAVITAVGTFGRRAAAGQIAGVDSSAIGAWLAGIAGHSGTDPGTRLAAVAELARCVPAMLPPDVSETVTGLLRMVYAAAAPAAAPAGFSTRTLVGALRELSGREAAGRTAPQAAELVRIASVAFGDRVEDRVELLTRLLREEGWEARHDALRPAKVLIESWRGSYEELVFLMGEQLLDPHPRLAAVAADALEYLAAEAAPTADALAQGLHTAPREAPYSRDGGLPPWVITWDQSLPTASPVLRALAALQDPRALPAVQWALERQDMPGDIGYIAGQFGSAAAELVPLICRRLQDLPPVERYDRRRSGLVFALGRIGEASAAAIPDLLALPPDTPSLIALSRIGPRAADAIPSLLQWLEHGKPAVEIAAAAALWRIAANPGMVLPTLTRHLAGDGELRVGPDHVRVQPVQACRDREGNRRRCLCACGGYRLAGGALTGSVTTRPNAALPTSMTWRAISRLVQPRAPCLALLAEPRAEFGRRLGTGRGQASKSSASPFLAPSMNARISWGSRMRAGLAGSVDWRSATRPPGASWLPGRRRRYRSRAGGRHAVADGTGVHSGLLQNVAE